MEHIPHLEAIPSFKQMRDVSLDGLESWDYQKHLERKVKDNHNDLLGFMEEHPSHLEGCPVISEIFRLEETIMVMKSWVIRGMDGDDELSYLRKTNQTK